MADIRLLGIPPQYLPGIRNLITIDDVGFEEIKAALGHASPSFHPENLVAEISANVKTVSQEDVNKIVSTMLSLNTVRESYGVTVSDFIEDITEFISNSQEFPDFSTIEKNSLSHRLFSLLSLDGAVSTMSKARSVMGEHHNVYTSSRVLTDLRPIFATEIENGVAGALIVHSLKIEYREGETNREFFVALDTSDLKNLHEQLDRANRKAKAIELMLKKAEVNYLDVE